MAKVTISIGERLSSYLNDDDTLKSDEELALEAQYLADQRWQMGQLALKEGDAFKSDEYLRGEAMALGRAMVGKVGGEDAYGVMWSPDQRGYKTGREFKDAMVKLWKEPESFVSKDWEEFSKLDRAGKLAKAMEEVSATKQAAHAVGGFLDDHVVVGGAMGVTPSVKSLHTDEEKAARQTAWEDRIIRDHEAKLRKKNAWMDLMAISSRMEGGAKVCLDALLQSVDNALPERLYTTFNSLSDRDKEIVCHARELMKPTWDGRGAGTVAHDAAVGLLNIAAKLAKSPVEQATKLTAIGANKLFDTGIDVNAIARRRQYLWNVTGGLSESKDNPFMEFEQRCEDHGIVGDALIGAVSTLPYMAAAAVPYAGPALVATEAMQEMDERVVAEGGDITDPQYLISSAVLGGIYAYIERLQVGKLLGEVGDLEVRGAMVKGLWAAWKEKPGLMAWNLTEKTLSESVQEGLQNGVMGVNEALALGKSVPAAFGEGFVEDFVGSLGTMFVIGAGGHVIGHAARSGWKGGAAGQKMRADSFLDAVRDSCHWNAVFENGDAAAYRNTARYIEAVGKFYGSWKDGGRKVLEGKGLTDGEIDDIEQMYREAEADAEKSGIGAEDRIRQTINKLDDLAKAVDKGNAALRADPARVGRAEKWLGRGNGLRDMRAAWARGNALSLPKLDEKGKPYKDANGNWVIEADLGAKELEKEGYAPEVAKAISGLLREEHAGFYSKGAVDAMRHAYEKATDRQTAAAERLAAGLKGGEVVRRDGLTFVRFDVETGKDADGKPIIGKGEYLIEEHPEFADFKPDFANPKANEAASIAERFGVKMTAEQWMSKETTPAEREAFWNENARGMEGNFVLVNPATGSRISAEGVKLLGQINIDPRAGGTAIYHENLHGYVRFCHESGVLTGDDIAAFVAAFGERRPRVDELFNEEAAADAARSFVVKRRAGSAIEDTPANRALAKLFSFGMRIAAEGDIRWAERQAAEKAMRAVTDQIEVSAANKAAAESRFKKAKPAETQKAEKPNSDNGKGGSDNGNAAEATKAITDEDFTKPTRDVSLPAMQEAVGDLIGANGRPVLIKKNIFEKNRDNHPELTPEESRRILGLALYNPTLVGQTQPEKRPHYWVSVKTGEDDNATVVVDVYPSKDNVEIVGWRKINDKGLEKLKRQAEREDGQLLILSPGTGSAAALSALPSGASSADSIAKQAAEVKQVKFTALTPTGNRKVGGHYEVVPLDELMDSNQPGYPMELQARDRKDNAAEEQTREDHITNFEPGYLMSDPGTDGGAPLVVRKEIDGKVRLVVVSGNGRTMILQALAARHMYDRYRGAMKDWAGANGVEVGVVDEANPVLVRVIDDLGGSTLKEIADLSNTNAIQQMNEEERARTDAEVIRTFGIAKLYQANADGSPDMTPGANDEFFAAFQRGIGMNDSLYNPDGSLTQTARDRAVRALLAIAVGQGERGRDTVKKLVAMADTLGLNRQRNAAAAMAAAVADLEQKPEYAIGADISRAYADYMDFVEQKKAGKAASLGEYISQQDMLDPRSEIAEGVLRLLGGSANARQIAETVKTYCRAADGEDPAGNLFGAARTREQIWRDAVKTAEEDAVRHSFAAVGQDVLEVAGVGTPRIAADMLATTRWSVGNNYADSELKDLDLVDIYRKGDPDALAELYRRHDAPKLKNGNTGGVVGLIARKYPKAHVEDKEEIHSKVWVQIIHDLDRDLDFSKFAWSTYLFRVVRWVASDHFGEETKQPGLFIDAPIEEGSDKDVGALVASTDNPWGSDGERQRMREQLSQLFSLLPADDAAVMGMIADGKTAKEIAKELGLHEYDVKNIKVRVIEALKKRTATEEPQARHVPQESKVSGPVLPNVVRLGHAGTLGTVSAASDSEHYRDDDGKRNKGNLKISLRKFGLSPSEMQVVKLMDSGLNPYEIAEKLGKRANTVYVHLSKARRKGWTPSEEGQSIRTKKAGITIMGLSKLEGEIWALREGGMNQADIVKKLGISRSSVDVHLSNARKKMAFKARNAVHRLSIAPKGVQKGAAVDYPDAAEELRAMGDAEESPRWSVGQLYTGSAADYEKPSLHYVGTGEGNQVYGWGLYASSERGVAEGYAKVGSEAEWKKNGKPLTTRVELLVGSALNRYCSVDLAEMALRAEAERGYDRADELRELREHGNEYKWTKSPEYLYEQTFFTDRAPGDESRLLKWYEPVSEEQRKWIEHGMESLTQKQRDHITRTITTFEKKREPTGEDWYRAIKTAFGIRDNNAQLASEFLARAGIDGVKYPVDSYGGKTVKDGDEVGWNYVSFRDDNIRVDHKWVDGRQRWSVGATDWGDETRKVRIVGGGVSPWTFVRGKKTREAKQEITKLASDNLKKQENYLEVGEANTPALRIGGVIFKIPMHNLFHGGDRRLRRNGVAASVIGDVLNASVEIPGVESPWHYRIAEVDFGKPEFVLITARESGGAEEIVEMQTLYSVNVKTDGSARELNHTDATRPTEDSIANLKAAWQRLFEDGISWHNSKKLDKNKIADLTLRGEAQSSLSTFSIGDDVATPEGITAEIIAKSAADRNPPSHGYGVTSGPRWSIGARRRAEFRDLMVRKRPDIAAEDVAAYLDEIAGYDSTKKQKLAVHWIITGAIELPEDAYKLDKAIATAERAKVDPFQYRNPEDIFAAFPQHLPKEKPIDPDTVPELTVKTDTGHGVTVYNVQDDRDGQAAMRKVLDTHWGEDANPWCLLARDNSETPDYNAAQVDENEFWDWWENLPAAEKNRIGETDIYEDGKEPEDFNADADAKERARDYYFVNVAQSSAYEDPRMRQAWHYWEHYSALPKKVAFLNGKLLAFMATYDGGARIQDEIPEQWWDRKDASHDGIPIEGKIAGDPLGRSGLQELKDGKLELVGRTWKGDRKNGKYEEWEGEQKVRETEFKDGRVSGWNRTYKNGKLSMVEHYNEKGEHDRPQLFFEPDGGLTYIEYGEGDMAFLRVSVDNGGRVTAYQKTGGSGALAKVAVQFGYDSMSVAWTDDAGDYYSTLADGAGRLRAAETIPNGYYGKRAVDMSDAAIRAKLEGESAAVLEAVKAEAAAIYREYAINGVKSEEFGVKSEGGILNSQLSTPNSPRWSVARRLDEERFDWSNPDIRWSIAAIGGQDVAIAETEPLTTKEAQDESKVRAILNSIVGNEYRQLGEDKLVKVGAKFPDEFWGSNTSQKLRDKIDKLWRAKVSSVPILKDILATTKLGPKEVAEHLNAKFKERADFYRCSTEFGVKRWDGVVVYKCDLLILEMRDTGSRYVYDIVKISKPTLTAKSSLDSDLVQRLYGQANLTGESATPRSIPNPAAADNPLAAISNARTTREVKSVDDMTYADDGSIIPAEERFDWSNPDIRWSVSKAEADRNVDEMLSKLDEAKGKSREEIFKQYDFHQKIIGQLPIGIKLPESVSVSNPVVKCAQNYLLAHLVVNDSDHHEVKITADDAKRIIGLIDPTNEMRLVEQRGSHSIAFIGQREDGTWDCICIAPKRGEYYVFKTMFAQKKKPYQDKSLIRFSVAPELGRTLGPDITGETPRPDATSIRGASTTPRSISNPAAADNPLAAIANARTTREVKSVDDMTYADDGSIIPAEARFGWSNPDIRWSVSKAEADRNVDEMLSKLDEAKGKSKEEIFKQYDNEQKIIGALPDDIRLPGSLKVAEPVVKAAQAYMLDHLLNQPGHEFVYDADDAKRVIGLIDPRNEMRIVQQRNSSSLAFIGSNPKGGWDCIVIAPRRGEFYVFKTMFGQKRKPYQDKVQVRYSFGSSVRNEAVGSLLQGPLASIRDVDQTPRSIPNPAAADNPLAAIANARTTREVEAAARLSFSARLADGDEGAAERALVNYVAYHKLTGGAIPRATTLAKLGLALGMKSVQAKRIIEDAQRVADRAAGSVIEKAARNGDVGTAFSLMEREKEREEELRKIISGGAKAGGDLVLGGVVAQGTLLGKRIEQTMRTMTAADLADMEGDTGIDLAAEILENDPKAFDEEIRKGTGNGEQGTGETDVESETNNQQPETNNQPLTDRERWMRAEAAKEAAKRVREFIELAKKRAEENKEKAAQRREENRQRVIAGEKPVEPGMGDTVGGEKFGAPEKSVAGFRNKWEFAAFVREWAWDKYQRTHGTTSLGKSEENRLFAEFYRKCATKMLQDLADKLLDPKGARAWANRRIGELEKGLRPDTIERASADIFAFINRNAIREERGKLIEKFRKEIREFITGKEFEELKADSTRRLTGWVEEAARYMMRVCQLSAWATNGHASAFEKERNELLSKIEERREVYDGSGRDEAYMEANDAEIVRARWKLALLEQYGGMAQMMPGEIESLREDAIRYLTEEAVALEERWKDTKERQDRLRRAIAGGIVGPNGQRYESKAGWLGHLFDDLNGLLRLRLKHLMRFAGKKERAEGEAAINEIVNMLGRGEVEYARAVQRDRRELFAALGRIFQDKEGRPNRRAIREYLKRMEEDIPVELSRQLSNQGFAEHMTYGQMIQLLVSVEQKSYAENVRVCGRGGQAELIRNSAAFTQADALFVDWLRAFYEAKRGEISKVTLRMVGNKVDSPDPLYCPVKIYRGELAKDLHIDAGRWNAIDDVLSRRVMHLRDFDESASVLGQFYDRSNRMAGLIAWAESGTVIQNVICSGAVQQQINLAFGSGESAKIRRQLEDTFNGGTSRSKTPGEIVFMDKAMNFITFGYLGFNPLSAAKQTTSFTVWANVLPGGFRELWHHMTHIDREAVRHIMDSDEYKVRYGDDTGSGQDFATKALNENAGQNPFMRLMTGPGMWLLKKGDFLPGIWIMQGVYKSLLNKHLNEGMDEAAADRQAITEAFNLLEETQQSGRTYNTSALAREHGRLGSALVQFATSPLQQLQYETQAFREWRDLKRYGADPERIAEARAKLIRAAFINHVLLPAAMELVITVFRAIMGDEPRWEKDGYAWDLLRDVLLGQASRIFYVGVLASSMIDALFKRQLPRGSQLIPSEGAITVLANVAVTAHDIVTLDGDKVQKDLERMVKSLAPTRIPYNLYRRVTGDSDVDRKKAKAK